METMRTIEGIDRFLLVACAFLFFDLPQIVLYLFMVTWPFGWMWGMIGAFVFGFILNAAFDVRLFGPRMGMKTLVYFFAECLPGIGAISLLSVALFVISYFHNRNIEEEKVR